MPADSNDQIEFLSLDDVKIQKHNVRTRDIDDGIDDLASSIKALGLLQPITAYYDSANSRYVVLAGQRRLNAHVLLNEKEKTSDDLEKIKKYRFMIMDKITDLEKEKNELLGNLEKKYKINLNYNLIACELILS